MEAAASRRRDDLSAESREAVLAERRTQGRGRAELGVPGGRDLRGAASVGWRGLRRAGASRSRCRRAAGRATSWSSGRAWNALPGFPYTAP